MDVYIDMSLRYMQQEYMCSDMEKCMSGRLL